MRLPLALIAAMLAGCSTAKPKPPDLPVYDNPELSIEIEVGREFALKCTEGGGVRTALHWQIGEEPDPMIAVFVRSEDRSPRDYNVGDGVCIQCWIFRATGAGETQISLRSDGPPAMSKTFHVIAR